MNKLKEDFKKYTSEIFKCANCIDWDDCKECKANQEKRKNNIFEAFDKADALDIIMKQKNNKKHKNGYSVANSIFMYFMCNYYKYDNSYDYFVNNFCKVDGCDESSLPTKDEFEFLVKVFTNMEVEK